MNQRHERRRTQNMTPRGVCECTARRPNRVDVRVGFPLHVASFDRHCHPHRRMDVAADPVSTGLVEPIGQTYAGLL